MPPIKSGFAPRCRILTPTESQSSFETWKETLLFNLTLDGTFEFLLEDGFKWKSISVDNRGLQAGTGEDKMTAKQKAAILSLLLGTIAGYASVISRQYITQEALSLSDIWHRLRIFYGFRKSGALILDLSTVHLEEGESYEALWERFHAFTMDNLLSPADGLRHLNENKPKREEMTPTLLNTTVVLWLRAIHPSLPALVKQRYSTELRSKTVATLREDISESLDALLAELSGESAANIARAAVYNSYQRRSSEQSTYRQKATRLCPLCEANNRPNDHFLSECSYLPEGDRRFMASRAKTRAVGGNSDHIDNEVQESFKDPNMRQITGKKVESNERKVPATVIIPAVRKVTVKSSPYLFVQYMNHSVKLTVDSGAEANMMKLSYAKHIGATIHKASTGATQADGISNMDIAGEVHLIFKLEDIDLYFDGLVSKDLSDDVLAGVPFMDTNDVYARPSKQIVCFGDREFKCNITNKATKAEIVRIQRHTVLLPGDIINLPVPPSYAEEEIIAIEPRIDSPSFSNVKYQDCWLQPQMIKPEGGLISLCNNTLTPVMIARHEQIATIRPVTMYPETPTSYTESQSPKVKSQVSLDFQDVRLDPDGLLSKRERQQFADLHDRFRDVFDSSTLGLYNGSSGPLEVVINMGPTLPPQRKGRMPMYSRNLMEEQQRICDELEGTVLLKPEEVGVVCEYLNPSFLVLKKSGKKRLVTAFGEVGQYSKPQPALMPDTNSVLRHIGNYKWIITSDLSGAYWQLPLSKDSMRYCGVVTPYRGVRVYGRSAMGMPGSETALEELLCRILGDQLTEGGVTKLADDIYCGGSSPEEVMKEWERVLQSLKDNGLRLSASKTTICPKSVSILGWVWEMGSISASSHRISTLATVDPPQTVGKLRSFVGSFKYLSRVMRSYSEVLHPLEEVIAGRNSSEKIAWTDNLVAAFRRAQDHLKSSKTLTMPRRDDQLQIVTDASNTGIGAALFVLRGGEPQIAGFFSSRYKKHQTAWMPCEMEALSISAAVTHFAPYIVQSTLQTLVLTDSLPCVQAFGKLRKGEFSSSARVSTFLSVLCRFNIQLCHLKGSENTYADFASRNAEECGDKRCQVCTFINNSMESVIRSCTVKEVLDSTVPVPYNSRSGWFKLQLSDDALRRACAHLKQGTKPSRKCTSIKDVKRYLQTAKVANDGLLVVPEYIPSVGRVERIVVPEVYVHGLLECLHLKLNHPSKAQLKKVFVRAFYALNLDSALEVTAKSCHTCVSLSDMPNVFLQQSATTSPTAVGTNFSADVIRRSGQYILLIREYISSYTSAKLIWSEKASSIRTALLILTSDLIPSTGMSVTIKVDPASACRSLSGDPELKLNGINLELGHPKNKNKNPVAERAIREWHSEINRVLGDSPTITEKILMKAVQNLNCRLRGEGVSAREIWTKRDQYNGEQIPIDDLLLLKAKEMKKQKSHLPSATFKARGKRSFMLAPLERGDLVYVNSDRDKTHARDRYMVTEVSEVTCNVQKFTGLQLRARIYTVNRADVITVQPWRFDITGGSNAEPEDSDSEDYQEATDEEKSDNEPEEHAAQLQEEGEDTDEDQVDVSDSDSEESQEESTVTRSGRTVCLPKKFADYTLCKGKKWK